MKEFRITECILVGGALLAIMAMAWCSDRARQAPIAVAQPATTPPITNLVDVANCFKVLSLTRADRAHYEQVSENQCGVELKAVYVLVKFFNVDGERIGVHYFGAGRVAVGERLRTKIETPFYVRDFTSIGVRRITADVLEAF